MWKDNQMWSTLKQEDYGGTKHISVVKYILKMYFQYKQSVGYMERNVLAVKSLSFFFVLSYLKGEVIFKAACPRTTA